ncbi:hypothetical protein [Paenibacillus polymyxa]|nr:hypothetical protein [Paenibacillus polymyxa]WGV33028.1 hypothetical protein MF627_08730 [Paenibacillus polymyxa]
MAWSYPGKMSREDRLCKLVSITAGVRLAGARRSTPKLIEFGVGQL